MGKILVEPRPQKKATRLAYNELDGNTTTCLLIKLTSFKGIALM